LNCPDPGLVVCSVCCGPDVFVLLFLLRVRLLLLHHIKPQRIRPADLGIVPCLHVMGLSQNSLGRCIFPGLGILK
ncbi:hypothetical protein XENOCAPTIV_022983, partial [Xenoophorus captivus]